MTREEILKEEVSKSIQIDLTKEKWWVDWWMLLDPEVSHRIVLRSMESYASHQTAALQKRVKELEGWKYCNINQFPPDGLDVLVSDGKEVWIGDYNRKRSDRDGKWAVVYNGAPPFSSTEIIMWKFKPKLP